MKYFFTIGGIQRNEMKLTNKGGERFPRSGSVPPGNELEGHMLS